MTRRESLMLMAATLIPRIIRVNTPMRGLGLYFDMDAIKRAPLTMHGISWYINDGVSNGSYLGFDRSLWGK